MKTIYIVRHAKAEGQPFHAHLTETGKNQANQLAAFLKKRSIQAIYSSPFVRAIETIAPFARQSGLTIKEDERLGERILSDQDLPDWMAKLKDSFEDFSLALPGGESNDQATERARSFIEDVLENEEDHIVCVSHGNLTTLLLRLFDEKYGYDELFALSNPDVYVVKVGEDEASVQRIWE
ncbi:histidine phosphatase family protein [Rossellomorea sp. NPDC071047]|uniref:histidine phosphatase family protein n=1 Tax=Rossellomorea sp. NPDC071047 TaxID=3390675 RepID=UPI003D058BEE